MIEEITIAVNSYICRKCLYEWLSVIVQPPEFCRNQECRTRWWNSEEPQRRSHADEIKFPAPRTRGRPKTRAVLDYSDDL